MFRQWLLFVVCIAMATAYQNNQHGDKTRSQARIEVTPPQASYSKFRPGRRVCSSQQTVTRQEPAVVSYTQSAYKPYTERCHDNQVCRGIRLVYETAYKTVYQTRTSRHPSYACCPGWLQVAKTNHGCHQAECKKHCMNGGSCLKPDSCACKQGYMGNQCEKDMDECARDKPCDQICHNTDGSFRCECREGFTLLEDGVSCRSEGKIATEAKDLDGDYEILENRILSLEKLVVGHNKTVASEMIRDQGFSIGELSRRLNTNLAEITRRLSLIEHHQENMERQVKKSRCVESELTPLRTKLALLERRLDGCNCKYAYTNGIYS